MLIKFMLIIIIHLNRTNHRIAQENQNRFNVEHGGLMPEVTNAIFTFVRDDPVRSLGVTQDLHKTAVSIMANGECTGSCEFP